MYMNTTFVVANKHLTYLHYYVDKTNNTNERGFSATQDLGKVVLEECVGIVRAISRAAQALRNKLPRSLTLATQLELFRKNLKTHRMTLI